MEKNWISSIKNLSIFSEIFEVKILWVSKFSIKAFLKKIAENWHFSLKSGKYLEHELENPEINYINVSWLPFYLIRPDPD